MPWVYRCPNDSHPLVFSERGEGRCPLCDAEHANDVTTGLAGRRATVDIPGVGTFPVVITSGVVRVTTPTMTRPGEVRMRLAAEGSGKPTLTERQEPDAPLIVSPDDAFRITSITDGDPADVCAYCGCALGLTDLDGWAHTLDASGEVTLCRACYERAGNDVR